MEKSNGYGNESNWEKQNMRADYPTWWLKSIGVKWVLKKLNEKGNEDRYKDRLVAKGYSQRQGIDYKKVFVPVVRWDTIRAIIALVAHKN